VEKKRRAKDGLPLKTRTRNDYLAMLDPGKTSKAGKKFIDGELYPLADKMLSKITADDIRGVYTAQLKYSVRQAVYAMQVMRAVLHWHGVIIPDNPLGRDTAGRDRIVLAPAKGNPAPIPPERLGAWWRAAAVAPSQGRGRLLPLPTVDRLPRWRDPWQQASRLPADQGRRCRS
jgi:hypothetical protein